MQPDGDARPQAERPEPDRAMEMPGAGVGTGEPGPATSHADIEGHHRLEPWSDREETHVVPEILRLAEEIVAVGSGTVVRTGRLAQSKWLVVLTDRRLLCIKGRSEESRKVIDMPVSQVREAEAKGLIRKTLTLDTGYGALRISGMKKDVAAELVEALRSLMEGFEDGVPARRVAPRAEPSNADPAEHAGPEEPTVDPPDSTAQELETLQRTVADLTGRVTELTERVAFLEELVRSNVALAEPGDTP
ncbi:MAG: hypothetical protein R3314_05105 [Longimicrobiales bacterium]|nr:hypothetical protein [Longimicrobiales bacterium]